MSEVEALKEFIRSLTDMELVAMQYEARQFDDKETLHLILVELGDRQRANLGDDVELAD